MIDTLCRPESCVRMRTTACTCSTTVGSAACSVAWYWRVSNFGFDYSHCLQVLFHAMASRTSKWWPLTFDISRSQSGLRIATTAAPATASDLERSIAEMRGTAGTYCVNDRRPHKTAKSHVPRGGNLTCDS